MSFALLSEINRTEAEYPRQSTIAQLFAARAAEIPDAEAVLFAGRRLSYREVDEQSNRLARRLQALGAGPDVLVGVAIERCESMLVGLLAVLKAGAAYVPLDLAFPKERLAWIIEDSGVATILTSRRSQALLPECGCRTAALDFEDGALAQENAAPVDSAASAENLAYVIYTSGSTGKPKGVMVENRSVVNFFAGMDRALGCAPGVWLAVTSISFDISVLELLWTLTRGFTVVIHAGETGAGVGEAIVRHNVTHLQVTPSLARMLTLDSKAFSTLGRLKQLLLGGEAAPAALIRHLSRVVTGEIYNMYGPTETTIWSTAHCIGEVGNTVPIGRPIANTQVYLLDEHLTETPIGEAGELFIAGDGVARGYWRRPELTQERFISIPALAVSRLYRTGDLARMAPDGNLEFLGRTDFQVKIRGHRIELGEIEALLEAQAGVRQAVVVVREDKADDKRLIAYLVGDENANIGPDKLREALKTRLPEYMVPSAFVFLDSLPLTNNGKADRKALISLAAPTAHDESTMPGALPEDEMERLVAGVWQDALGLKFIGRNANFFDLGAHSLTVAQAQAALQEILHREIELIDLFQYTNVASLARFLAGGSSPRTQVSDRAQRRRMARHG